MFPDGADYRKCVPCRRLTQALRCPACGTPTTATRAFNIAARATPGEQFGLTPREAEVMERIADGRSYVEVAGDLGIARDTVKEMLRRARSKMGASNRMEAARMWWEADG
jgi:DNA-binding CsgD family transcriptional regulator